MKEIHEKMNIQKEKESFEAFMENPYWKETYENAPSEECKDYWRFSFYLSEYYDPDAPEASDFLEMKAFYHDRLSIEDWKYIKKNSSCSPFRGYINNRIKQLQEEANLEK